MCSIFTGLWFTVCVKLTMYGNVVDDPFETSDFQRGVNTYITSHDLNQAHDPVFTIQLMLDRLQLQGINSISITWPIYTANSKSNRVYIGDESLTPDQVELITNTAKARGFGVWLHPILDEKVLIKESPQNWRGQINPQNKKEWFSNYKELMSQYANAGRHADGFIVGTELWSMEQYHSEWADVVASVKVYFDGVVSYTSNRTVLQSDFDWTLVDAVGINYFPSFDLPNDATADEIAVEVQKDINEIMTSVQQFDIPVIIFEAGTTSQMGSISHTGRWDHKTTADQLVQLRYYQAVCQRWPQHVDGIYWWNTSLYPISIEELPQDGGFDAIGKPAASFMSCKNLQKPQKNRKKGLTLAR